MIGQVRTCSVTGYVYDPQRENPNDRPVIEFREGGLYNPQVQEGSDFGPTVGYPGRFLLDTEDEYTIHVQLDRPAKGGEQVTVTCTVDDQGWDATPSMTGIAEYQDTFTHTFSKDQREFTFKVKPLESTWFRPRRLLYKLTDLQGLKYGDHWDEFVVVFWTNKKPPSVNLLGVDGGLTTLLNVRCQIWCGEDGTSSAWQTPQEDIVVKARIYDVGGNNITSTAFLGVTLPTDYVEVTIPAGATPSGSPSAYREYLRESDGTLLTLDIAPTTVITLKLEGLQPGQVSFQETTVDPRTGLYTRVYDVYEQQNLWFWTNDIHRLGYENDGLVPGDHKGYKGTFGGIPGWPVTHGADGAVEYGPGWPVADVVDQTSPTPAIDPVTGNALQYQIPSANIKNGNPYLRESFGQVYCGGPLTGHPFEGWLRASYCIEIMREEDQGVIQTIRNVANDDTNFLQTKQTPYVRVGMRCRSADRNHGVAFEMRCVDPPTGYGKFADQTKHKVEFTFVSPVYDWIITLRDYTGYQVAINVPSALGAPSAGTPPAGVPVLIGDPPASGSTPDFATAFYNAVQAAITGGLDVTAAIDGSTVTITQGQATISSVGSTYQLFGDAAAWSTALGISPSVTGLAMRCDAIVDNGRQSTEPVYTYSSVNGDITGTADPGQYYYDSVTGCEIWFLKRYNLWNPGYEVDGSIHRPTMISTRMLYGGSHNAWGSWYGVERTDQGLTVYTNHYLPRTNPGDTTAYVDQYCYAWDLEGQYGVDNKTGVAPPGFVGYNTFPPISAHRIDGVDAAAEENASKYQDNGLNGWEVGRPNASPFKGNSIEYPSWFTSTDRSNGEAGYRPYGVNTVRSYRIGGMWHSQRFEMAPAGSLGDDPPWGPGAPKYFWRNQSAVFEYYGDGMMGPDDSLTQAVT